MNTTLLSITPEQATRDERICEFMSGELDRQIRNQFSEPNYIFGFSQDRMKIVDIFSGRFVNYIFRQKILIREGGQLPINTWYALGREFVHETEMTYSQMQRPIYDPAGIAESLLVFLHKKGYSLELP
jgi:hypothetical protein